MNRVILENQKLKEERKGKAQELEDSNKRARLLEDQKDDLDHILLGSTSVIRTRKEELRKAEYRICELGRLLDKSLMDKKEIKLDFEAQIRDLRDALKKCEEKLSREILQKEEAERNCHHLRNQLEEATRRFAVLESQEGDAAYLLLKNDCVYWKRLYREARASLDEDQKKKWVLDVAVSLAKATDVDKRLRDEKSSSDGFQEATNLLESLTLKSEANGLEQQQLSVLDFLRNQMTDDDKQELVNKTGQLHYWLIKIAQEGFMEAYYAVLNNKFITTENCDEKMKIET
ncbi:hypothetical protein KIW84_074458 [Lathyrus oleraceus]|uniref:Uncharacterized protein n=1 Tax=Pisum sativum TaxID=3888 RepID=A0A9D4VSV6_PEA|nr:hypothetical protein KIW84_074458 [Pisum sativum]